MLGHRELLPDPHENYPKWKNLGPSSSAANTSCTQTPQIQPGEEKTAFGNGLSALQRRMDLTGQRSSKLYKRHFLKCKIQQENSASLENFQGTEHETPQVEPNALSLPDSWRVGIYTLQRMSKQRSGTGNINGLCRPQFLPKQKRQQSEPSPRWCNSSTGVHRGSDWVLLLQGANTFMAVIAWTLVATIHSASLHLRYLD